MIFPMRAAIPLSLMLCGLLVVACGGDASQNPSALLLGPGDIPGGNVTVVSRSEEQSLNGPTAQVELQGPGYRVLQSAVLFEDRESALSALDGIRADLVSQGATGPGGRESSGILEHTLGSDKAASLFFIEDRALVRMTVTGSGREERLSELAEAARDKLSGG